MSRFLDPRYSALKEYTPGEQPQDRSYIKLNTNESPFPPSPGVIAAVNADEAERLNLYSDPQSKKLKAALADAYLVQPENVFVSNGSDDILSFAFMAYSRKNGVAFPDISYGFYKVYAGLYAADTLTVPLDGDFNVDVDAFCGTGRFTVIANPNAPTGIALPLESIERIAASNPDSAVLIDEAYVDFGGESAVPLTGKYNNLLCVMTFSKSRSMAGARLGFAIGAPELIADLEKIKFSTNPYNINRITQAAGLAALAEQEYYDRGCRRIIENREYAARRLKALGFSALPSRANFIFARHERVGGEEIYLRLKELGILVRHFTDERIKDYNRITIGSREQMDALLAALEKIVEEKSEL